MAKSKLYFKCVECDYEVIKWLGKCPQCHSWNSLEENNLKDVNIVQRSVLERKSSQYKNRPQKISEITQATYFKFKTGILEFDRVIGNGVTKGSINLLGGDPGVGKSTLLMNVCERLTKEYSKKTLYVSGEESCAQIANRSKRLNICEDYFYILNETCWQDILDSIKKLKPSFIVLDSIQTTVSSEIVAAAGTVSQIREVTYELMNYAKANDLTCFVIGHVTKEGNIAGPKILEHMVDTVIYFEGDQQGQYRMLRVIKNRFGNTNEVGIFEMNEKGLAEVRNPSEKFMNDKDYCALGSSLTCVLEGTRSVLVEVQALVVENKYNIGRRTTQGVDSARLAMIIAVIDKYFDIPLSLNDIFVNIAGGLKLTARESDLSILASLLSSYTLKKLKSKVILIGEVGLTGEIRFVTKMESRIKEIEHLNYKTIIMSRKNEMDLRLSTNMKIIGIEKVTDLNEHIF